MDQTGVSLIEESWGQLSLREKQVLLDVFLMDGHHHKALLGAICQGIFSNGPKFQSGAANLEKNWNVGVVWSRTCSNYSNPRYIHHDYNAHLAGVCRLK